MPLVDLTSALASAEARQGALLGLVCLGWEDAAEFVAAGEATDIPIILQAGPGARAAIPVSVWGKMFRTLAEAATVPVVVHLDHGHSYDECAAALDAGFTSIMFDGSRLPLAQNITETNKVRERARASKASLEAEIGFVGYAEGEPSEGTCPQEAAQFARETDIDCLAVSVGNVHLTQSQSTPLDWDRLAKISAGVPVPLVLHGGSGVPDADRQRAAREFRVRKINLGTEIRQAYGAALRNVLGTDAPPFDRLEIAREVAQHRAPLIEKTLRSAWG